MIFSGYSSFNTELHARGILFYSVSACEVHTAVSGPSELLMTILYMTLDLYLKQFVWN